jgi:hypothetical protein
MVTTVDAYGAPSYGPIGRPPAGVVFHTPENASATLQSAIDVARWQAGSGNTSGGSYHGILGHDSAKHPHPIASCADPTHWTMVRSVPWNLAAGGLSTRRDAIWAPDRYPWIRQMIPAAAFSDPNRWMHQISLSGKAAWYVQNGYPLGARIALAEWLLILEKAYTYDAVLTLHRHWQTNRSDPGPLNLAELVLVEYRKLTAPPPPTTPPPPPPPPATDPRDAKIAELTATVAAQSTRLTTKDSAIDEAIAKLQTARKA